MAETIVVSPDGKVLTQDFEIYRSGQLVAKSTRYLRRVCQLLPDGLTRSYSRPEVRMWKGHRFTGSVTINAVLVRRSVATPSPIPLLGALILALCLRFISSGDPLQHCARQQPQQPARLGVAPILGGFVPLLTAAIGRHPCRLRCLSVWILQDGPDQVRHEARHRQASTGLGKSK